MNRSGSETRILVPLIVLSVAQLIAWGSVSFLSVVSREMAADLNVDISTVFAGTTVFYVTMGACAPLLSRLFTSFGARPVMIAGTVISAFGLGLLSFSHSPVTYFLCWFLLGAAGSATLTTPAHILLNELAGRSAARAIATLSLVSGLYGTVFWPLTSFLSGQIGWRGTCEVYALTMVVVCLPLYSFGLPRRSKIPLNINAMVSQSSDKFYDRTFLLVAAAIALNAFITFGFSAILIELLKVEGLSATQALAFGSALGVIQVGARGLNIILEKRWDGVAMGFVSSAVLCVSLAILWLAHGSTVVIAIFLVLYGISTGALAVARSTIPLVFYDKADFAKALSRIALPLNWISAISPPVLISLMTNFGSSAVLILSLACSCSAILVLLSLRGRRPASEAVASAS
ncbi:MFS transporter [Agrobacterium sp. SHOUNA12C]|nr:MFS transporter [Agrobacterium sp. BETTINA12B]MCJ9755452.1 MFS transporter [Agrobacterium sp. SHOUNA12C]NTG34842.1 MFS transporter [Rhizobium rhizogenes]NTG54091.1 MFS transporter [Rhizobium rhizogenes]NTH51616.1 MFS transporter [Rhizobium rhizogenes]